MCCTLLPEWSYSVLTMHTQILFNQILLSSICIDMQKIKLFFLQRYRRYAYFSSTAIVHLKIMQSDWTRGFCLISQESNFSRIWDLCRNLANNINFHYRPNSDEINDYFFQYIFKILFLANFRIFETNFSHQKI